VAAVSTLKGLYRQEEDPEVGVTGCTILEYAGGPKTYARIWDSEPGHVEWGWVLNDAAVVVWQP